MEEIQTQSQGLEALELHEQQIINQCRIQAQSFAETGKLLKQIKDGKEFTSKGFESFTEYMNETCGKIFPFKSSQAYKYIRVFENYGPRLEQYTNLSLDILDMYKDVSPEDFEDVSKELEGMTVKEAEELKKQLEAATQQISFLSEEVAKEKNNAEREKSNAEKAEQDADKIADERLRLSEEIDRLNREIKAIQSKPVEVAVTEPSQEQIDKLTADIEAKFKQESQNIKAGYEQKLEKLTKKLDKEKSLADEKAKELESKLQNVSKSDEKKIEFKFYFEQVQENLKKFLEVIEKIEDKDKQAQFRGAAIKFIDAVREDLDTKE